MEALTLHHDARSLAAAYAAAEPFPHIAIDGLFDDATLERVLEDFPDRSAMKWMEFDNPLEKKLGYFHGSSTVSPVIRDFLEALNGFEKLFLPSGSPPVPLIEFSPHGGTS